MKLLVFLSVIVYVSALHVNLKKCEEQTSSTLIYVDVDPCTAQPCTLQHGKNYTITVDFKAALDFKDIGVKIFGVLGGIPIAFPFDQPDACSDPNSGVKCPVAKGTEVTYVATLPVKSIYPAIKLLVKWELVNNADGSLIVCDEIPVAVISSDYKEKDVRRLHFDD